MYRTPKRIVYCPLYDRDETIYYVKNYITDKFDWNGCEQFHGCAECGACRETYVEPAEPPSIFNF